MWTTGAMATSVVGLPGYTPEQWAAATQHNWQQWAQWQEQYRQWQLQYGEKYTEQMMNYQAGTQPPLPPAGPSEARPPPPPDGPPPQLSKQSADDLKKNQSNATPGNTYIANSQYYYTQMANRSGAYTTQYDLSTQSTSKEQDKGKDSEYKYPDASAYTAAESVWYNQMQSLSAANNYTTINQSLSAQNAMLSEEERQFDLQFKQWEEEFEAWKQQNINHPDKASYQDYEKKFQACRAQLMERKEQMRAKRLAAMISQKSSTPNNQRNFSNYESDEKKFENDGNSFLSDNTNFLTKDSNGKSIPGLDLVDEQNKRSSSEVVDITDDDASKKPDLKAISKGISNILGDQKLLNMLSMVAQNTGTKNTFSDTQNKGSKKTGSRWTEESGDNMDDLNQYYKLYQNARTDYSDIALAAQNYSQMQYNASQSSNVTSQMYGNTASASTDNALQTNSDYYDAMYSMGQGSYNQELHREYYSAEKVSYNTATYDDAQNDGSTLKPQWLNYPILEPNIIVDYQHKPIKPFIEFLEPVQTFDYGHVSSAKVSKDDPTWMEHEESPQKTVTKTDFPNRGGFNDNDNSNDTYKNRNSEYSPLKYDDRFRDGNDRFRRTDRNFARERDYEKREERRNRYDERNNRFRDKSQDSKDRYDNRSSSEDRQLNRSRSQSPEPQNDIDSNVEISSEINSDVKSIVMIDDILESPGRDVRPEKIIIILRGLPGSGKSYLAKLIKDREVENGGSARILSMDDYFMFENEVSNEDSETGRKTTKREMKYEYDPAMEETYIGSLIKSVKRTVSDGFFPFIIVDSINDQLQHFVEIESSSKQLGFKTYVCEMDLDVQTHYKRNIHDRKLEDIQKLADDWCQTPSHFTLIDATTLLQTAAIDHVQMEDVSDGDMEEQPKDSSQNGDEEVLAPFSSKWDKMDDNDQLAKLDGTSKPLRHNISTMEDFLQLDEWDSLNSSQTGKKVRWADIEERRKQEKMRAIGFVVGQTDWGRMTDPTQGSSALTQTKYIERIHKY